MPCALYLRSSKDRSDVSIDAQRRALAELAKSRNERIVAEYADAVFSGKDEDRPGFQRLIAAVRDSSRGWDTLLVLDTSRLARRRYIATMFEHDAEQAGVRILYKSVPDADPMSEMLLKSFLQAMDEWHSMVSRAKGLAGMAENVRQGYRAGGRAPIGYELQRIETGTIREGQPVRKSKLIPGPLAPVVQKYLQDRAAGVRRSEAAFDGIAKSSLVGIEWNALTYAGHTVWNVNAEAGKGHKRRPRSEWVVQRDTHPALISDDEAERLLANLEGYSHRAPRTREAGYLLTGMLVTPDGKPFHGDRGAYRTKGRQVRADALDEAVVRHVLTDLQSASFVRSVTKAAKGLAKADAPDPAEAELRTLDRRMERLLALAEETDTPAPIMRRMEALERDRQRLEEVVRANTEERTRRQALRNVSEIEVRRLLVEQAAAIEDASRDRLAKLLRSLVDRIELEGPAVRIFYRIRRDKLASPRGSDPIPVVTTLRLAA